MARPRILPPALTTEPLCRRDSMAADTVNLNRLSYSSAGGPRRRAFPVETASFDKSSGDIRGAHADLIRRLQALPPYRFDSRLQATPEQLELQADTLRCNLLAVQQYVVALVRDTAYHTITIDTDRLHLDGLFRDIIGDLCGAIG